MTSLSFMIPVIQLGVGWWLNVSTLVCLYVSLKLFKEKKHFSNLLSPMLISCVFFMYLNYIWQDFGEIHSFLRVSRECLVLILLTLFLQSFEPKYSLQIEKRFHRIIACISLIQLAIVVIQIISISQGVWFGPDPSWFAGRGNVIPDILDLRYSVIRPAGTFSEPSYLGLASISLMIISGFSKDLWRNNSRVFYLNFLIILLSQSKSALLFALVLLAIYLYRNKSENRRYYRGIAFPFILIGGVLGAGFIFQTIISSKGSVSIENRIYKPLEMFTTFIASNPLGASFYDRINGFADTESGVTWESISHNSFFNLIFSYGLVGILIITQIMRLGKADLVLKVFLFASLLQNGAFLDFDKLFLVYFTFAMYRMKLVDTFSETESENRT